MSQLRFDRATNSWVVFAPSRSFRPHERLETARPVVRAEGTKCPFCPGNEALTPPEIHRVPAPDGSWLVRVMPNKFPALRIEENPARQSDAHGFQYMGGCGAHEVIVESPDHDRILAQQPPEQIERVLQTLQMRYHDLMGDHRFQTVVIFKNHGVEAGTSLAHPHWQLIATPVVPPLLRLKHILASEYFDRTGDCLYRVMLRDELSAATRVVAANDSFAAVMPYASHVPFETWIVPRQCAASFRLIRPSDVSALAGLLKTVLLKLCTALDNPPFNLTIDDVARGDEDKEYFLWHMRILPRQTTVAGFELGSGMAINTVLPEEAVAFLSETDVALNGQSAATANGGTAAIAPVAAH